MVKTASRKERRMASRDKRKKEHKSGFQSTVFRLPKNVELFQLKAEGLKRIDILPSPAGKYNKFAEEGELYFELTFYTHARIGAEGNSYVCPAKTAGKKCPICEHRARLQKKNADPDEIKALAPKERQLFWVRDYDDGDSPKLWEISFHLFGKQLDAELDSADEDEDVEKFWDLEDGLTLKLGVSQEQMETTKFYAISTIGFKPRKEQYDDSMLEKVKSLDSLLIVHEYDDLKKIFLQIDDEEDEQDDDDETPAPKKKKPVKEAEEVEDDDTPPKKKKKPVDEETKDEEPEDDEDEEPEVKVKKKPKPEPEEEEDDEEPAPKKKKKPDPEPEEEEEEARPKKKPATTAGKKRAETEDASPSKKKKAPKDDDDEEPEDGEEWDDGWDDEDE